MSIFTPTTTGNVVAGLVVGTFQYSILLKLDKIPFVRRFVSHERKLKMIRWICANKGMSFLFGEAGNMGIHSGITDPNGAMFALGNSVVNAIGIWGVLPWYLKKYDKEELRNTLEGV